MKTLNPNTKKAKAFIEAYERSSVTELWQAYGRYSTTKHIEFKRIKEWCRFNCGYDLRIISWNTFHFTCAWREENNLLVETKIHSYIIPNAF